MNTSQHNESQTSLFSAKRNTDEPQSNALAAFPDEVAHLAKINAELKQALKEADASVDRLDREYTDLKLYMTQNRGEIDPQEMFQNELALKRIDHTGAFAVNARDKVARLVDSPYFGRIDFHTKNEREASAYYIGRSAFTHNDQTRILDWRAPIAGMFYDCEVGPAGYEAPSGCIEGQLTRKRQFRIKHGTMEYALESAVNIQDDILQRELSHTSDEKMKSIIATIQKEQNQIIRSESGRTLIIQGVAGSGKTSIALHRIAFLLYRFKERLKAQNVAILSPNKVFANYISNVLPELGEEPICEWSFEDIALVQLNGMLQFDTDKDPLETHDPGWAQRVRFKSTLDFLKRLDDYIRQLPERVFEARDYTFGGFTVKTDWIQTRFLAYHTMPVKRRLQSVADDILYRFESDNFMGDNLPKARTIYKTLCGMLRVKNSIALYRDFYMQMGVPSLFVMPAKHTLEWADVYPFLYLHAAFEGLQESKIIRHLVIDEMQDYTPVQYAVINRLFPCPKTILGDFGQRINPNHLHTLNDLQLLYDDATLISLNKSYRSTSEIIRFAKRIQQDQRLNAIERHGEEPCLIQCRDNQEQIEYMQNKIKAFSGSEFATMGIITKTNQEAKVLFDLLSSSHAVHLITPESTNFANGVTITSVQMAKGLEFDTVVIPFADDRTYSDEYDRGLLYVACTRAMHQLTLTYTGQLTKLVDQQAE